MHISNAVVSRFLMVAAVLALSGCNCGSDSPMDAGPDGSVTQTDGGGGRTDAGPQDAGAMDAGAMDAGAMDAGAMDAGSIDAGSTDAGSTDAGVDAGLPLVESVDDGTVTLPHNYPSCAPAFGVAADGTVFLAHSTPSVAGVRVVRLTGSTWVPVGGLLNPVDQIPNVNICPAMVVTSAGVPYVGFVTASATTRQVRVMRFVNAAWEVSFFIERPTTELAPALALDLTIDGDVPVLALVEFILNDHYATVYRLGTAGMLVAAAMPGGSSASIRVGAGAGLLMVNRMNRTGSLIQAVVLDGGVPDLGFLEGGVGGTLNVVADVRGDSSRIVTSWHVQGGARAGVHTALTRDGGLAVDLGGAQPGSYPSTVLRDVVGLTQVFTDSSNPTQVNLRSFDGGTWSTPIPVPLVARTARLVSANGQLFMSSSNGINASLVRLNFR
ncbi:MAG: hypothetical protein Q8L14_14425 [Myxococcales bacterium]|nr:hypothetical protein [Myxococcales bacterium]